MKKLPASLLFLPFIAGATITTAAPSGYAPPREHAASAGYAAPTLAACASGANGSISSAAAPASQPALPGHLSAGAVTLPTAHLETGTADTWRSPTRSGRSHSDPLHPGGRTAEARTHIHMLQRGMLEFEHTLARARTNEPATFGNPPPASQT